MQPKVSVVIPNYNHARYLPRRIASVLQQTEKNIEILLLDDCSTDESRAVITRYARQDARIRLVLNEHNSGNTFAQWNKGVAMASGEYIWLAESDDYAAPTLLAKLCALLDANPSVGLAYCDSWHVDENGRCLGRHTVGTEEFDAPRWRTGFLQAGPAFIQEQLSEGNAIPNASAVLLRRSVLEQVGVAETNFKLSGDWVYWIRVLAGCDVAFLAEPLNFFRQHPQNVRSNTSPSRMLLEGAKMIRRLRKHVNLGREFDERRARHVLRQCFYAVLYKNMRAAKVRKVLSVLNKSLPNFRLLCLKECARILFSNKLSGLRQLLGDGLLYRALPKSVVPPAL